MVNVQKSPYGGQHYINVGFWFPGPHEMAIVAENKCPISRRLERIFPDAHELLVVATDTDLSTPELIASLSRFIRTTVEPFVTRLGSRDELRRAIEGGTLGKGLVAVEARTVLQLD